MLDVVVGYFVLNDDLGEGRDVVLQPVIHNNLNCSVYVDYDNSAEETEKIILDNLSEDLVSSGLDLLDESDVKNENSLILGSFTSKPNENVTKNENEEALKNFLTLVNYDGNLFNLYKKLFEGDNLVERVKLLNDEQLQILGVSRKDLERLDISHEDDYYYIFDLSLIHAMNLYYDSVDNGFYIQDNDGLLDKYDSNYNLQYLLLNRVMFEHFGIISFLFNHEQSLAVLQLLH